MAVKIVVGLATYLQDFDNLQGGLRSNPYVLYATDLDVSFTTLRTTINQMIDEINGIQGPNAGLGIDILIFDDLERPASGEPNDLVVGKNDTGFVGLHSGEITRSTVSVTNDAVTVDAGLFIIDGVAVRSSGAQKTSSGTSGTRYICIDLNGAVYVETAANARNMDLWSTHWDSGTGTFDTGVFVRQNQVFFDGDEYEQMRARPAAGTTPVAFALRRYETFHSRMEAVERMLAGFTTDNLGNALGVISLQTGGTAALPSLAVNGDVDTGIFASTGNFAITTAGTARISLDTTAIITALPIRGQAGAVGAPAFSFSGDTNTGVFSDVADTLKFATAGVLAGLIDPQGNHDLTLNARVKGVAPSQSIADNTATLVDFSSADVFDVPFDITAANAWHDAASGTLATRQEFTVPTGADGTYQITVFYQWASPTNATQITVEVTIGGTAQAEVIQDRIAATTARAGCLSMVKVLAATNVLRVRVTQDDTGGAAALNLTACTFSIVKVA